MSRTTGELGLAMPLFAGVVAAAAKVVYSFLLLFNLIDVALFFAAGVFVGRRGSGHFAARGLALSAPAVLLSCYFLVRIRVARLLESGIGIGWAVSAVIIPLSAIAGIYYGTRGRVPTR